MKLLHGLAHLAVALWVGAVATIAFLVAPHVFATFDKKSAAGTFLGPLFTRVDYFGVATAVVYVLVARRSRLRSVVAGVMGAAAAVNAWGIAPRIAHMTREDPNFGLFHTSSMVLWAAILIGGALLVFLGPPPVRGRDA